MTPEEHDEAELLRELVNSATDRTAELIVALTDVRRKFDAGDDDWRPALLRTLREHARAVGVERKLLDPIEVLLLDTVNEIRMARRREADKAGTPMPVRTSAPLTFAAAAVTVKKKRGARVADAIASVAKLTGIDARDIRRHRDNLHRGKRPGAVMWAYENYRAEMSQWSEEEVKAALDGLGKFVI